MNGMHEQIGTPDQTVLQNAPLIVLYEISRSFGEAKSDTPVLNRLSLKIGEGSFTVIRGPSGVGKTTLLRILGLLDHEFDGTFIFDGYDVTEASSAGRDKLRSESIGFVFQEGRFLNHLTLAENISLPLRLRGAEERSLEENLEKVADVVFRQEERDTGLLDKRPLRASGGQRQRAALARAIITKPKLILADEPTASLDQKSRKQVLEQLQDLHGRGSTIIVVSHDPIFFEYGDQFELRDGRLNPITEDVIDDKVLAEPPPRPRKVVPGGFLTEWLPQLPFLRVVSEALTGLIRRPLLTLLTLVSLVAGICQVAILVSILGGAERIIDQAISDGSRLTRVTVRPRTVDLPNEVRFPLRDQIAALADVVEVIPRRSASFTILADNGAELPFQTIGLHPNDPEFKYFTFIAGEPLGAQKSHFGIIATPAFLTEVFGLGDAEGSLTDWTSLLTREVPLLVPRFNRAGQKTGEVNVTLHISAVILNGEGGREFYVSNALLVATDAIKRDRTGQLTLPESLADVRVTSDADELPLFDWPWEDMLHIYLSDIEKVVPVMTSLVGLGFRPEAELWNYLWVLDLQQAALSVFVPLLILLGIVVSLVLICNVYISARLRESELALCRVLGMGRGDIVLIEVLSLILLALIALSVGLFTAQILINFISEHLETQYEILSNLSDEGINSVAALIFTPIPRFVFEITVGTVCLVVVSVLIPAVSVGRTDPAIVFSRQ